MLGGSESTRTWSSGSPTSVTGILNSICAWDTCSEREAHAEQAVGAPRADAFTRSTADEKNTATFAEGDAAAGTARTTVKGELTADSDEFTIASSDTL